MNPLSLLGQALAWTGAFLWRTITGAADPEEGDRVVSRCHPEHAVGKVIAVRSWDRMAMVQWDVYDDTGYHRVVRRWVSISDLTVVP